MKTFSDTEGRQWHLRGTLGTFEAVKTATGVDLLDLPTTQECLRQISDVFKLGAVLYVMCERQATERGITPEQFADGFNADVLHSASEALVEEVIFFCRKDLRPALEMAFNKAKAADRRAVEMMQERIQSLGHEMDEAMESFLTSTDSVTSLPASSVSIPANGPSAGSSGPRKGPRKNAGAIRRAS